MLRVSNIKLSLEDAKNVQEEQKKLRKAICDKLRVKEDEIETWNIFKKSVDARKKQAIVLVYTLDVSLKAMKREEKIAAHFIKKGIEQTPDMSYEEPVAGNLPMEYRPVIVGTGPAGLFAGLFLARRGYKPLLLERGDDVDRRTSAIQTFWKNGILDTKSNVQFGEGGAGTFSDGKLTTLINDKRCRTILHSFITAGAPEDILYKSKPHIGTDILRQTVKNIREEIIRLGGEVRFRSQMTDILIKDRAVKGVVVNHREEILCDTLVLALGHSARDTFELLYEKKLLMQQKAFSIGVRIEHAQHLINQSQYGAFAEHPALGAADYKMAYHSPNGRSAYTFCMCPGGYVVAAASEEHSVVTNGMSEYRRNGKNANAALLVSVNSADYGSEHVLAGVEFQRKWERLAYRLGGENYCAPIQKVGDFLQGTVGASFGEVEPTYLPRVVFADLRNCLPDYVTTTMKEALLYFEQKLHGFASEDAIMTGVETRSSSPVRICRDENFVSNIHGIYPAGEGAGYAGGIMSSAVDGVKIAEKIISKFKSFEE